MMPMSCASDTFHTTSQWSQNFAGKLLSLLYGRVLAQMRGVKCVAFARQASSQLNIASFNVDLFLNTSPLCHARNDESDI